ncbi:two-component system sensor histidine kinase NtrB [Rhodobaculum claviforme]|uniref:histidine kinase n=1 Tax=Rhodobaculum claviforme TaxID=1549854 RepID=A0A934TL69_9RHOB|nr:ATP-binding protein [Rhodobaculum claviforme]MBK5927638.1 PAS domain-containing sensor histidine kinase [Rhodobaculum claviforme]
MSLPDVASLWAALPVPVVLIDGDDRLLEVNPEAEEFFNASARSLRGRRAFTRLRVDAPVVRACARARRDQAPVFITEVEIAAGDRAALLCDLRIAPLEADSDHLILLIAPRETAGRLARAKPGQVGARSAIGMAEMLAHEIKNPLAGISGAAQLLSMSLSAEDRELTDLIVAETRRVVKLLEQVEQFGNLRPPELGAVNIHDILDRARRSAVVGYAARMRVVEDYDPSLPPALADGDQLLQVVLNLLKNAAQAAGEAGGTIRLHTFYDLTLRLRGPDGSGRPLPLQIEVIDDGPGLPPAIAEDVFEPFVSGRENGTGLGLALASKIIADHGGWITVESAPGRTVFRISLPVAPREPLQKEG